MSAPRSGSTPAPRVRLKRIDEGHYLVPGTDYEVVHDHEVRAWCIYRHNTRLWQRFTTYENARAYVIAMVTEP